MPEKITDAGVGLTPPPDAPIETSQPLQSDAQVQHLVDRYTGAVISRSPKDLARQNERELAPLKPLGDRVKGGVEEAVEAAQHGKKDPFFERLDATLPPHGRSVTPAGSDSESPSRGMPGTAPIPKARTRPPERVSGGFGDSAEAQYYPINGDELRVIIAGLLDRLEQRLKNDLRMHIAISYPRLSVRASITVQGELSSQAFEIEQIVAHDKTPLAVAQQYGDSVVFVLSEQRREFDDTTTPPTVEDPPDAMREEVGLARPHKQIVQSPGVVGKQIVDRLIDW